MGHLFPTCANLQSIWADTRQEWEDNMNKQDLDSIWLQWTRDFFSFWEGRTPQFERIPGTQPHFKKNGHVARHSKLSNLLWNNEMALHDLASALDELELSNQTKLQRWKPRIQKPALGKHNAQWVKDVCRWIRKPARPVSAYIQHEGQWTTTPGETVDVARDYFAAVYQHDDAVPVSSVPACAGEDLPEDAWDISKLRQVISQLKSVSSPGMGSWAYSHIKQAPEEAVSRLHDLFLLCLIQGKTPAHWLHTKLVLLPKKGSPSLPNLRPITVEPAVLRLFNRWMLRISNVQLQDLPRGIVGGIPRRETLDAWLPTALLVEEDHFCDSEFGLPPLQCVSIDTAKFLILFHINKFSKLFVPMAWMHGLHTPGATLSAT